MVLPYKTTARSEAVKLLRKWLNKRRLPNYSETHLGLRECVCNEQREAIRYSTTAEFNRVLSVTVIICGCMSGSKYKGLDKTKKKVFIDEIIMNRWKVRKEFGDMKRIAEDVGCSYRTIQNAFLEHRAQQDVIDVIDRYYYG